MFHLAVNLLVLIVSFVLTATDAQLVAAGRTALSRGDVRRAVVQLERAVALKPDNAEARYYLGLAYGRSALKAGMIGGISKIHRAKEEWSRAVAINPNYVEARMRLIDYYIVVPRLVGGSTEKALAEAAEIKRRDSFDGHRAYARIYTLQKRFNLAVIEMVQAVRERPGSAKAHYLLGDALLSARDFKASLHEFEMAISLDSEYMPAYFRIGQLAAQSHSNYRRGEEALRKYLRHAPADDEPGLASAWYWLGTIQERQGKAAEAKKSYSNAHRLASDARDLADALKRNS